MTAVQAGPLQSPALPDAAVRSPAAPHPAGADGLAFGNVLDGVSTAQTPARTARQPSRQTETPEEGRRHGTAGGQAGLPAASIHAALSSLFCVPEAEDSGQTADGAAAPVTWPAPTLPKSSPQTAPQPVAEAKLARLVGARSFVLPTRSDVTDAATGPNTATICPPGEQAVEAQALFTLSPRERATGPLPSRAASPHDLHGTAPGGTNAASSAAEATAAKRKNPSSSGAPIHPSTPEPPSSRPSTPAPRSQAPLSSGSAANAVSTAHSASWSGSTDLNRQGDDPGRSSPGDNNADPGPATAIWTDASSFSTALPQGGLDAQAASAAEAARPQGAAPAAAAQAKPPVREIDLDLSPSGLDDVTMTVRLADDRLSLVFRAGNSHTAGAIESAREAIAERLAAIGQPLSSFIIHQTGNTDGAANADARSDQGGNEAQNQDQGYSRGGGRRGSGGF